MDPNRIPSLCRIGKGAIGVTIMIAQLAIVLGTFIASGSGSQGGTKSSGRPLAPT